MIPTNWERLGSGTKGNYKAVNAIVYVDANLDPDGVKLTGANASKVYFIASGSQRLKHPNRLKLCEDMIKSAKQLRTFLPVLLGLGLDCLLEKITDDDLLAYEDVMKDPDDDRFAQVLLNYDRVHSALADAITEYTLDPPLLFQTQTIDRTALTYYNGKQVKTPLLAQFKF